MFQRVTVPKNKKLIEAFKEQKKIYLILSGEVAIQPIFWENRNIVETGSMRINHYTKDPEEKINEISKMSKNRTGKSDLHGEKPLEHHPGVYKWNLAQKTLRKKESGTKSKLFSSLFPDTSPARKSELPYTTTKKARAVTCCISKKGEMLAEEFIFGEMVRKPRKQPPLSTFGSYQDQSTQKLEDSVLSTLRFLKSMRGFGLFKFGRIWDSEAEEGKKYAHPGVSAPANPQTANEEEDGDLGLEEEAEIDQFTLGRSKQLGMENVKETLRECVHYPLYDAVTLTECHLYSISIEKYLSLQDYHPSIRVFILYRANEKRKILLNMMVKMIKRWGRLLRWERKAGKSSHRSSSKRVGGSKGKDRPEMRKEGSVGGSGLRMGRKRVLEVFATGGHDGDDSVAKAGSMEGDGDETTLPKSKNNSMALRAKIIARKLNKKQNKLFFRKGGKARFLTQNQSNRGKKLPPGHPRHHLKSSKSSWIKPHPSSQDGSTRDTILNKIQSSKRFQYKITRTSDPKEVYRMNNPNYPDYSHYLEKMPKLKSRILFETNHYIFSKAVSLAKYKRSLRRRIEERQLRSLSQSRGPQQPSRPGQSLTAQSSAGRRSLLPPQSAISAADSDLKRKNVKEKLMLFKRIRGFSTVRKAEKERVCDEIKEHELVRRNAQYKKRYFSHTVEKFRKNRVLVVDVGVGFSLNSSKVTSRQRSTISTPCEPN